MLVESVLSLTSLSLISIGLFESLKHRHNISQIPVRIHINGTRGKTSITRLIAAGLRAGGYCVAGKKTGTLAALIYPDGSEVELKRPLGPNIIEQVRFIDLAAALGADAIVTECMALTPNLQTLTELCFMKSTHGVITNVGPDHLDIMGPSLTDVAVNLARTIPRNAHFYTNENDYSDLFEEKTRKRKSVFHTVEKSALAAVSSSILNKFQYWEHRENVALALKVCADNGVSRDTALSGMYELRPDPGALTAFNPAGELNDFLFVNAFGANDPEATNKVYEMVKRQYNLGSKNLMVLINCRGDRVHRSVQLGRTCSHWRHVARFYVIGTGTNYFVRAAVASGVEPGDITNLGKCSPSSIIAELVRLRGEHNLVLCIGNTGSGGLNFINFLQKRP